MDGSALPDMRRMMRFKVTQYDNGNPVTERSVDGTKEAIETYAALVLQNATTCTRAGSLIASAESSIRTLPIGAGIAAFIDTENVVTIHRLVDVR